MTTLNTFAVYHETQEEEEMKQEQSSTQDSRLERIIMSALQEEDCTDLSIKEKKRKFAQKVARQFASGFDPVEPTMEDILMVRELLAKTVKLSRESSSEYSSGKRDNTTVFKKALHHFVNHMKPTIIENYKKKQEEKVAAVRPSTMFYPNWKPDLKDLQLTNSNLVVKSPNLT